jgi:hypothetical protein
MTHFSELIHLIAPDRYVRRIRFLVTGFILLIASAAVSQNVTVKGKVTDAANGEAIPGGNVVIKGTANGTVTNIDGDFSLGVPSHNATLVDRVKAYNAQASGQIKAMHYYRPIPQAQLDAVTNFSATKGEGFWQNEGY